jgi:phage tail sheath protein FI
MPLPLTYPGVYVEEIPSGVHTVVGVATSITAFVGRAPRGDVNDPVDIGSFGDYVRDFGGLSLDSSMSYAVQQFFQNGGSEVNPVADLLLRAGLMNFVLFKSALVALALLVLCLHKNLRVARIGLWAAAAAYAVLIGYHLILFCL